MVGAEDLAVVAQTDTVVRDSETRERTVRRWTVILATSVLIGAVVYVAAVWTATGQTLENAALRGADQVNPVDGREADTALDEITVFSLAVGTALVCAIGLLRRRPVLAFAAGAIIAGGQVVTQTLKRFVLPRPDLVDVSVAYAHNSLPSGHTTIAMTVLFAMMVVVPYRFRGMTIVAMLAWAVGIGSYTIVAKWHRLSDTLAADAVALAVATTVCLVLTRTGHLRPVAAPPEARYLFRSGFAVVASVLAAGSIALGAFLIVVTWNRPPIDEIAEYNFFLGAQSLSWAGSIVAALVFWWSLHRVSLEARTPADR